MFLCVPGSPQGGRGRKFTPRAGELFMRRTPFLLKLQKCTPYYKWKEDCGEPRLFFMWSPPYRISAIITQYSGEFSSRVRNAVFWVRNAVGPLPSPGGQHVRSEKSRKRVGILPTRFFLPVTLGWARFPDPNETAETGTTGPPDPPGCR